MKVRVGVANVAKFLSRDDAREDINKLLSTAQVCMANELASRSHRSLWSQRSAVNSRRVGFPHRKVQVSFPNHWHAFGKVNRLTYHSIVNPARFANALFCPDQGKTVFVVTHLTNGAWNRKRLPFKSLRRWLWRRQVAKLRVLVARWLNNGWNVVLAGDWNRGRPPHLHDEQKSKGAEYMHVIAIPAPGNEVELSALRVRWLVNSDHPQVSVNVEFKEKK